MRLVPGTNIIFPSFCFSLGVDTLGVKPLVCTPFVHRGDSGIFCSSTRPSRAMTSKHRCGDEGHVKYDHSSSDTQVNLDQTGRMTCLTSAQAHDKSAFFKRLRNVIFVQTHPALS